MKKNNIRERQQLSSNLSILLFWAALMSPLLTIVVSADTMIPAPFGRIYLVYYRSDSPDETKNDIYFKTAEIGLKGKLKDYLRYRILIKLDKKTLKFEPLDAFCAVKVLPFAELLIGQFKPPFGMERLIPSPEQDFVITAMATKLLPERDIGVALFRESKYLEFNTGILNGAGYNKFEDNSKKDVVGRLILKPLKETRVGGAIYWGYQGPDTNIAKKRRYNFQAELKYPKFHIRSEFAYADDDNEIKKVYYAQTGYKFGIRNKCLQNLEPVMRYENSTADNQKEKLTNITLGTNLYFYDHRFKCQINYNLKLDEISNLTTNEFYTGLQVSF